MNQADIWLLRSSGGSKARPVLIVTRSRAIPVLSTIVVAPITSTLRDIPTTITVDSSNGVSHESIASFDNLTPVPKDMLARRLGDLGPLGPTRIGQALSALADC